MKDNRVLLSVLVQLAAAAGFLSCSLNYEGTLLDEEMSDKTPNAVLINFSEVSVRKGSTAYIVRAEKAEAYNRKNLTVFSNLYFAEYSSDNEIATEGKALLANFYSDTENIEFSDDFSIKSLQQGYYIEGRSVSWNGKEKVLSGDEESEVTIGRDDGSYIRGRGFRSAAADKSFSFENGMDGRYISDDDEDPEEEEGEENEDIGTEDE